MGSPLQSSKGRPLHEALSGNWVWASRSLCRGRGGGSGGGEGVRGHPTGGLSPTRHNIIIFVPNSTRWCFRL